MRTSPVMMQKVMMYGFSAINQSNHRYSHLAPWNPGSHLEEQGENAVRTFFLHPPLITLLSPTCRTVSSAV